jgi:hypothetical protein
LKSGSKLASGFLLTIVALTPAPFAYAQQAPPGTPPAEKTAGGRRTAVAHRTSTPPSIDGVLDERAWQDAPPLTDFIQAEPFEGTPSTERTEVRILYDSKNIYIGVTCYEDDPSQIVSSDSRRDASLSEMDSFQIIFDTFRDRQNGFVFGTNPAGSQYDAQIRNEGETGSNSGAPGLSGAAVGSGGGVNVNWDAVWEVKARITNEGWVAEFSIPLRTLRYGPPPQEWGINLTRNIRHKRETVYWSPVSRAYNLYRLSSAGDLTGLAVDPPRNFKVAPYAISNANRLYTSSGTSKKVDSNWGVDAKYGVTPSLNLDLTYNTDFAQVEVDQQQINLTRFNLVFPEKRPFFLENAGLFAVGRNNQVDLFYSRRIGIDNDGSLVPIRGGARLSGKVGNLNVGVLNMQTERVGATAANNFSAMRVNRELPNRSRVGGIFLNRSATGDPAGANNWNRTWGLDGKLGVGQRLTFNGWAGKTETPGLVGRQYAFSGGVDYNTKARRDYFEYVEVGEKFNPELGFLERTGGYRQLNAGWFEHVRSQPLLKAGFRELYPHQIYQRYWKFDGQLQSASLHTDVHLDWENGLYWSPAVNLDWDRLDVPFNIYPGVIVPPGEYRVAHTAWQANTDRRRWISANTGFQWGGFLSGHQNSVAPGLTVRKGAILQSSFNWTRQAITLPQGAFVANLGSWRVSYNFSTLVNVQSFVQYNDRTGRWSTNFRFSWLNTASSGLFLVYNDTEALQGLGPINRSFVIKYSRQFDILN